MLLLNRMVWLLLTLAMAFLFGCMSSPTTPVTPVSSVPTMGNCTCYYAQHAECKNKDGQEMVCTEDYKPINCIRQQPKGGADFGKCTTVKPGQPQMAGCDGTCTAKSNGSACGIFDVAILNDGLLLWRNAINEAASSDSTNIDPQLIAEMDQLPLSEECRYFVGRTAFAIMELCRSKMTTHPDELHSTHEHPIANLSNDACQMNAGNHCFDALMAGLEDTSLIPQITAEIEDSCSVDLPFSTPCVDDFDCANKAIRISAEVLQIERVAPIAIENMFETN